MTNYEKIKNMSVEEMASAISENTNCVYCPLLKECKIDQVSSNCHNYFVEWLNKEVSE